MKRTNLEGASMKNCKFEATGAKHQKANLEGTQFCISFLYLIYLISFDNLLYCVT